MDSLRLKPNTRRIQLLQHASISVSSRASTGTRQCNRSRYLRIISLALRPSEDHVTVVDDFLRVCLSYLTCLQVINVVATSAVCSHRDTVLGEDTVGYNRSFAVAGPPPITWNRLLIALITGPNYRDVVSVLNVSVSRRSRDVFLERLGLVSILKI